MILEQAGIYKSIKGYTGWSQFAIILVMFGAGFVLTAILQLLIGMQMVPEGTAAEKIPTVMLEQMAKPEHVTYARIMQALGTFALLFIPAFLFNLLVNGKSFWWLGMNSFINVKQIGIGFLLIFFANILATPLADFTKEIVSHFPSLDHFAASLEDQYNKQVNLLSNLRSWSEFVVAIFIMAFLPALFEELFFRGALQNLFTRWWKNAFLAIVVTSFLFSLIHASVYLFISRMILGFVLGAMFYQTKNLWVNIIAHFLNNFFALCQMFYISRSGKPVHADNLDPDVNWWVGLLALGGIIFLFRLLDKYSKTNIEKIAAKEAKLVDQLDTGQPFKAFN